MSRVVLEALCGGGYRTPSQGAHELTLRLAYLGKGKLRICVFAEFRVIPVSGSSSSMTLRRVAAITVGLQGLPG